MVIIQLLILITFLKQNLLDTRIIETNRLNEATYSTLFNLTWIISKINVIAIFIIGPGISLSSQSAQYHKIFSLFAL